MVRLRKIEIVGFRGARFPLSVDFGKSNASMVVFGENAAGKSSITDAVEWFFSDRIEHLWKEDCKEGALRNVRLDDSDNATVSIEFSDGALTCTRSLDKALKIKESNTSDVFRKYKAVSATERIILRTTDLNRLADESKGDKRKRIAQIIGYETIVEFRDVIQKAENSLQKADDYVYAKRSQDDAKTRLLKTSGGIPSSFAELFTVANAMASQFSPATIICDSNSYNRCLSELAQKISHKDAAKKQQSLGLLKQSCGSIAKSLTAVEEYSNQFLLPYSELIADKEKIRLLDLEAFLSKGKILIDNGQVEPDKCPFCERAADIAHISQEVERRLQKLQELKVAFQKTRELKDRWVSNIKECHRLLDDFERCCADLAVDKELIERTKAASVSLKTLCGQIEGAFGQYHPIPSDQKEADERKDLSTKLQAKALSVSAEITALELTGEEQKLLAVINALEALRTDFESYQRSTKTKESFERQIKTLATIRENFIQLQAESLQDVLDVMSDDIKRYYLELHPKENIDGVRLRILGTEGVEFEYSFHGKTTYPPKKYLSESHLNSLGLALFLASAKLFNKVNRVLVLDDVVTSFDASHRLRLLRLLKTEFHEWQILLLTHQRHWFQVIKKELGSVGWLLREVDWTEENGVRMKGSPQDTKALIALKRSQGHDVANDLRTLLEELLKELCHDLEVKVAFRFNDRNEQRMPGDLLPALRGTLKTKSPGLNGQPIWVQLETSNHLGTVGSHDNPKEISLGEIDVALEDIEKFEKLFRCEECRQFVRREYYTELDKKLSCKCGNKTIPWKD